MFPSISKLVQWGGEETNGNGNSSGTSSSTGTASSSSTTPRSSDLSSSTSAPTTASSSGNHSQVTTNLFGGLQRKPSASSTSATPMASGFSFLASSSPAATTVPSTPTSSSFSFLNATTTTTTTTPAQTMASPEASSAPRSSTALHLTPDIQPANVRKKKAIGIRPGFARTEETEGMQPVRVPSFSSHSNNAPSSSSSSTPPPPPPPPSHTTSQATDSPSILSGLSLHVPLESNTTSSSSTTPRENDAGSTPTKKDVSTPSPDDVETEKNDAASPPENEEKPQQEEEEKVKQPPPPSSFGFLASTTPSSPLANSSPSSSKPTTKKNHEAMNEALARLRASDEAVERDLSRKAEYLSRLGVLRGEIDTLQQSQNEATEHEDFERAEMDQVEIDARNAESARCSLELRALTERLAKAEEESIAAFEGFAREVEHAADELELARAKKATQLAAAERRLAGEAAETIKRLQELETGVRAREERALAGKTECELERRALEERVAQATAEARGESQEWAARAAAAEVEAERLRRLLAEKEKERDANLERRREADARVAETEAKFAERKAAAAAREEEWNAEAEAVTQSLETVAQERAAAEERRAKSEQEVNAMRTWLERAMKGASALGEAAAHAHRAAHAKRTADADTARAEFESNALEEEASWARSQLELARADVAALEKSAAEEESVVARAGREGPLLETQKQAAVAARNFKEAARLAGELKEHQSRSEAATRKLEELVGKLATRREEVLALETKVGESVRRASEAAEHLRVDRLSHILSQREAVGTALRGLAQLEEGGDRGEEESSREDVLTVSDVRRVLESQIASLELRARILDPSVVFPEISAASSSEQVVHEDELRREEDTSLAPNGVNGDAVSHEDEVASSTSKEKNDDVAVDVRETQTEVTDDEKTTRDETAVAETDVTPKEEEEEDLETLKHRLAELEGELSGAVEREDFEKAAELASAIEVLNARARTSERATIE